MNVMEVSFKGKPMRFIEWNGRCWVAAVDVAKALGYCFPISKPSTRDPETRNFGGNENFQLDNHRRCLVIRHAGGRAHRTWMYDYKGFTYALWPRFTKKHLHKNELKNAIQEILRHE